MKQAITICKRNEDGSLTAIKELRLMTRLNATTMEIMASYRGHEYTVQGNVLMQYIVVEA